MEFEPITTQEAFDAAVQTLLEQNTQSVTNEITKKYEGWAEPEKITELNNTVSELKAKNQAYENSALKLKIAHETGIPYELAEKLSGSNEKEIRADAEKLAEFTVKRQQTPKFSGESPVGDPQNAQKTAFMSMLQTLNKR